MLEYKQLQKGVTKVLLPNDCVGTVTEISPMKTMKGGLMRGRDKVKVAYVTVKGGWTEAWFQLRQLRKYEIVIKKIPNDIQPVEQGEEPWKEKDTFNGTPIIDQTKTEEVIVPVVENGIDITLNDKVEKLMEDNKEVSSFIPDLDGLKVAETEGINDILETNTQSYAGEITMEDVEKLNEIAPPILLTEDEMKEAVKKSNPEINKLPDATDEDKLEDDDGTEMVG